MRSIFILMTFLFLRRKLEQSTICDKMQIGVRTCARWKLNLIIKFCTVIKPILCTADVWPDVNGNCRC